MSEYFWFFVKILIGYLITKPILFAFLPLINGTVYIDTTSNTCRENGIAGGIPARYGPQRENPIVDVSHLERNADIRKALENAPMMERPPPIKETETSVPMTGPNGCKYANTLEYIIDRSTSISGQRIDNIKNAINAN